MESEHIHPGPSEDGPATTGFLPLTLAIGLFVMGLFVLGIVPGVGCDDAAASDRTSSP